MKPTQYNREYLSYNTTTAIKGVFAIIILFSHTKNYLAVSDRSNYIYSLNYIYNITLYLIGQLMVVMFLLYSGYGIIESYKKKQREYTKCFFKRRIIKTLIHFDLAVLIFLILAFIMGHDYSLNNILLSFTGWESIGNSNWFVFDIIILYLLTYCGLIFVEKYNYNIKKYLWIITGLTCCFALTMYILKDGSWWWDTLLAFPTGMLWSVYKDGLTKYLSKGNNYRWSISLTIIIFSLLYITEHTICYGLALLTSAVFGILIVLISLKLHIGNPIIHWLGINAFSIYILQRIPMIIFSKYNINENHLLFTY
ncbi:MAG: acyltransferase family protein [Bacilli bacterium]|nr:acyltransferase family protein [Bacilli bacterium]